MAGGLVADLLARERREISKRVGRRGPLEQVTGRKRGAGELDAVADALDEAAERGRRAAREPGPVLAEPSHRRVATDPRAAPLPALEPAFAAKHVVRGDDRAPAHRQRDGERALGRQPRPARELAATDRAPDRL